MSESRLTELEIRVAFQEDTIAQLNDALVAQQMRIDATEHRLEMHIESMKRMQDGADPFAHDPPPHY